MSEGNKYFMDQNIEYIQQVSPYIRKLNTIISLILGLRMYTKSAPLQLLYMILSLNILLPKNIDFSHVIWPEAWFCWFSFVVQEFGMTRSTTDHLVFYYHTSSGLCIYLIVYVDDVVITSNDKNGIQRLKQHLFSHFQTKDLGKLKYFLGIELNSMWL